MWDGRALRLGAPAPRTVRWRDDGLAFVRGLRAGDVVSLHWDFVCDVLTAEAAARLAGVTRRVLTAVNDGATTFASRECLSGPTGRGLHCR